MSVPHPVKEILPYEKREYVCYSEKGRRERTWVPFRMNKINKLIVMDTT